MKRKEGVGLILPPNPKKITILNVFVEIIGFNQKFKLCRKIYTVGNMMDEN